MSEYHNLDCMEGMKEFPDKYFELAIVDPPYGIGDFNPDKWTDKKTKKRISKKYEYVTKESKWNNTTPNDDYFKQLKRISINQIIWGANYYNCFSNKGGAIVWNKENPNPYLSSCEIASQTFFKKVDYYKLQWHGLGMHPKRSGIHPCEKPIKLYEWLLTNYAKQGDKLLDTHVGSGSSIIAFKKHNFDYVGFEIDKDYYKDSSKRINDFKFSNIEYF